jgi:hypothetical protein
MIFLDNYSYFDHLLDNQVSELEDNKDYQQEIKDEEQIKQLNNPEQIENMLVYYMKKTRKIFTS